MKTMCIDATWEAKMLVATLVEGFVNDDRAFSQYVADRNEKDQERIKKAVQKIALKLRRDCERMH